MGDWIKGLLETERGLFPDATLRALIVPLVGFPARVKLRFRAYRRWP